MPGEKKELPAEGRLMEGRGKERHLLEFYGGDRANGYLAH